MRVVGDFDRQTDKWTAAIACKVRRAFRAAADGMECAEELAHGCRLCDGG
jgi:hypothetical protein